MPGRAYHEPVFSASEVGILDCRQAINACPNSDWMKNAQYVDVPAPSGPQVWVPIMLDIVPSLSAPSRLSRLSRAGQQHRAHADQIMGPYRHGERPGGGGTV